MHYILWEGIGYGGFESVAEAERVLINYGWQKIAPGAFYLREHNATIVQNYSWQGVAIWQLPNTNGDGVKVSKFQA